jgi:hypothetical protein
MNAAERPRFPARLVTLILVPVIFACATVRADRTPQAVYRTGAADYALLLERYQARDDPVIRTRIDANRSRLWVLTVGNVYVYDIAARTLLHRVRLPNGSVADFTYARPPDLIVNMHGAAFISNNVEPRLLQIEPSNFRVKAHELRIVSPKQAETGFASLRFGRDGTLLATAAVAGSTFRIDIDAGTAEELFVRSGADQPDVTFRPDPRDEK